MPAAPPSIEIASVEDIRVQHCAAKDFLATPEQRLEVASKVLGEWTYFVSCRAVVIMAYLLHQTILQGRLLVSMRIEELGESVDMPGPVDTVHSGTLDVGTRPTRSMALKELESAGYLFRRRMGEQWAIGLFFPQWRGHYPSQL